MSPWLWLLVTILFEVAGTICLKLSCGLTKFIPSALTFVFYFICFAALSLVLKRLDVGVAYAIWAGLGTALIALVGILHFGEPITIIKIISLAFIVIGVVGLNISGGVH